VTACCRAGFVSNGRVCEPRVSGGPVEAHASRVSPDPLDMDAAPPSGARTLCRSRKIPQARQGFCMPRRRLSAVGGCLRISVSDSAAARREGPLARRLDGACAPVAPRRHRGHALTPDTW